MEDLTPLYTAYLEEELSLNQDGTWFHNGVAFQHKRLSLLFHRSIQWDEELKTYVVRIGKGRATFEHHGFVRFVLHLTQGASPSDPLSIVFADQTSIPLDYTALRISAEDEAFLLLLEKDDSEHPQEFARFTRLAQQEILEYAESERALTIQSNTFIVPFYDPPSDSE